MTLRRYAPIAPSAGTRWPDDVRRAITARDGGYCVGKRAGFPADVTARCLGRTTDIDHVRASGGMGMKSSSTVDNGVLLDPWCHRWKTENGKVARPLLLTYIDRASSSLGGDCGHVDPNPACSGPCNRRVA